METTISENQKNVSAFIHLSTFLKYFFPFANFIAPLLIWTFNKEKAFVDEHGKQAINFQLSVLVYTVLIGLICLPFFIIFATDFISLIESIDHNAVFSEQHPKSFRIYIVVWIGNFITSGIVRF